VIDPVDHLSHAMAEASGTLPGHVLPGFLFLFGGIWWAAEALFRRSRGQVPDALEGSLVVPTIKLGALVIGGWFELPGSGWSAMSQVMGWAHITIYMGFGLSGVVDLLRRSRRVSPAVTYAAFGGAALNAAFLLATHGNHVGVETTTHRLLAVAFAVAGAAALGEATGRARSLQWLRIGAVITLGAWWVAAGWLLFLSGWDLADPIRVLWLYPMFSWTALTVSLLLVAAVAAVTPAERRQSAATADPVRSAPVRRGSAGSGTGPR
jgi:hypothetical protein